MKRRKNTTQAGSSAVPEIELEREKKNKSFRHEFFFKFGHPSANPAEQSLTLVIRRDAALYLGNGDSTVKTVVCRDLSKDRKERKNNLEAHI